MWSLARNERTTGPGSLDSPTDQSRKSGELWEPSKNWATYTCKDLYTHVFARTRTRAHMQTEGAFWRGDTWRSQHIVDTHSDFQTGPPPGKTHLWASSFCFSNSMILRSCSFCFRRSASMDFCFWSCCLLCISLNSYKIKKQVMHEATALPLSVSDISQWRGLGI